MQDSTDKLYQAQLVELLAKVKSPDSAKPSAKKKNRNNKTREEDQGRGDHAEEGR